MSESSSISLGEAYHVSRNAQAEENRRSFVQVRAVHVGRHYVSDLAQQMEFEEGLCRFSYTAIMSMVTTKEPLFILITGPYRRTEAPLPHPRQTANTLVWELGRMLLRLKASLQGRLSRRCN